MKTIIKQTLAALTLLTIASLAVPAQAAPQPTISMVDVRSFNPDTFRFPGGQAFNYRPYSARIGQDGTVSFYNRGFEPHTVTSYSTKMVVDFEGIMVNMPVPDGKFDSPHHIESGETWTLDASSLTPGEYKYFCEIHPWMQAVLRVREGSAPASATVTMDHRIGNTVQFFSGSGSWGFTLRSLSIRQGTIVTVVDKGILPHTFSSYATKIPIEEGGRTLMIPIPDGVFESGLLTPGQTFTLDTGSLDKGSWTYFCQLHPWMQGSLTIS